MINATKGIFGFLCFALVAGGCQRTGHVDGAADATTLRIAFEAKPSRIDPRFAVDAYSARIQGLVFASLVTQGPDGGFRPYLAKSWRWIDERTCVFDLTDGFSFSDGAPVDAEDVVATYRAVLAPDSGSPRRAALTSVVEVETEGNARVRFRLSAPDGAFLEGATLGVLAADQADDSDLPPGELRASGPYRVAAVARDGGVRLEKNPYFRHSPVPIANVEIRVIPDVLTRVLELEKGSIDLVQSAIDPDTVDWLERRERRLRVTRTPSANFQYLGINLNHPSLADVRVRRAIAHAIDRNAIVAALLNGQARVASSMLPPEHWAHPRRVSAPAHDPARSRELLDAAGLHDPDGDGPLPRIVLSFKTTTDELARRIGEVLAAQLAEAGIRIEIRSYDWGTFFADVQRGDFHLYSLQWVGIGDPDILRQVLHSEMRPPVGANRGGFVDRRSDALTVRARSETRVEARRRLYARIERRVARLLPYVPLWWPERIVVSSRRLIGFRPHPAGDLLGLLEAHLEPDAVR
ncbi:MAG TPA: ABC transporter substrate-binding protein [Candidatus Binatia bacterium]|nr:ABC transporter substrate-binding protein [Candidatus Binatia bacterium]